MAFVNKDLTNDDICTIIYNLNRNRLDRCFADPNVRDPRTTIQIYPEECI